MKKVVGWTCIAVGVLAIVYTVISMKVASALATLAGNWGFSGELQVSYLGIAIPALGSALVIGGIFLLRTPGRQK